MLKKQIQKLLLTGLLGLILFSIFPIVKTNAADCNLKQYFPGVVQSNKSTVAANENFDLYLKINMDAATFAACKALQPGSIAFSPWPYKDYALPGDYVANVQITYEATEAKDGSGYEALIKDTTLNKLGYDQTALSKFELFVYGYYHFRNDSASKAYYITSGSIRNGGQYAAMKIDNKAATHEPTATLPTINAAKLVGVDGDGNVKDYAKVNLSIKPNTNGTGLRSKYRIKWDDGDLNFGTTGGLEGVHLEWQDDASVMRNGVTQFTLPKKDNGWGYDSNPYFSGAAVYFNYAKAVASLTGANLYCKGTSFGTDCSGIMFREADNNPKGSGHGNLSLPADLKPSLKIAAWQSADSGITAPTAEQKKPNGNQGKPIGTIEFVALPAIIGQKNAHAFVTWEAVKSATVDQTVTLVASNGKLTPFTVEVFGNDEDIKTACKADAGVTDKTKCDDLNFAKYQFAEPVTQTSSSSEAKDPGTTQSLYDFIVRVISQIVIWLTALIYKIFSYFVVPVLNALLQVRPYQDAFVNIIYPGWLILRNLANIFFIISLLIVGLRILFQSSEASTSRGFIVRLILMALLVNFSLVISQGVVGIADTVQSQFMPGDTKIIEALGNKLMVEPILSFRASVSPDGSGSGQLTGDQTIADTAKPIVLLVLAIAALFSFIAIAAFLAVRLVALMVLYMVAPIAYASYVMKDTERFMSMWWSNFLKYAFLTPVLVFFLNIAALVATVFSGQNGNVIKLSDNLSGDLVAGGLTIATHFIVLMFIYAGMIVAQKSGTIGSKAIVDYSKKGFDALTKKPAKWAANTATDLAKSAAQDQYTRRIKGGLFDPMAYKQAWKDSNERKNSRLMNDRLARAEGRLSPTSIINNPLRSAKYLATGGRFGGGKLLSEKEMLEEEAGIMNDSDRADLTNDLATAHMTEAEMKQESDLMNSGKLSFETAQAVVDRLDAKAKAHEAKRDELLDDAREATAKGRTAEAASKTAQAGAEDSQRILADRSKTDLESQLTRARGLGSDGVTIGTGLKAKIGIEFNFDEVKDELNKTVSKLEDESKQIEQRLDQDSELRNKYNYGPGGATMDAARRGQLEKGIEAYSDKINSRELPLSMAQREARLARERAHDKSIEELDGEELEVHFENALKDNNSDLAIAIAKKIAKEGDFDQLLEHSKDKNGDAYKNNIEGFQKFLTEKLGKIAPTVRMQVGSEISSIAQKNGNYAIGKATKVGLDKSLSWRSGADHNTKIDNILRGKKPEDMVKAKKFEITRQKASGGHELYKGAVENFNKMNDAKLGKLKEQMSSKLASHIVNSTNFLDIKNSEVREAIKSAAG